MQIETALESLLLQHNCVIVPEFGGFVAKKNAAKIDYSNGCMYPPTKSIVFNGQLQNNDGLLINELATKNALKYFEAEQKVSVEVKKWKQLLKDGGRINLDKIGYLYADENQNIRFEQDRFFNLLMESYGLGKVYFVTENKIEEAPEIEVKQVLETVSEIKTEAKAPKEIFHFKPEIKILENKEDAGKVISIAPSQSNKKLIKYLAAACILPIAFYAYWLPMETKVLESGMLSISDFNPFRAKKSAIYKPVTIKDAAAKTKTISSFEEQQQSINTEDGTFVYQYDAEFAIPIYSKSNSKVKQDAEVLIDKAVETSHSSKISGNHFYIVGCFGSLANARNLVKSLVEQGLNGQIVDMKGGLHRVAAGSADSATSLQKVIDASNQKGFDGWVLEK